MSETTPEATGPRVRKPGEATYRSVFAELEETTKAVRDLAGDNPTPEGYRAAGGRLTRYGANPELVDLAIHLADTDAYTD